MIFVLTCLIDLEMEREKESWSLRGLFCVALAVGVEVVWDKTNIELKKKVMKDIYTENNIEVDFFVFQGVVSHDRGGSVRHRH